MRNSPTLTILITALVLATGLSGCLSTEGITLATVDEPAEPQLALRNLQVAPGTVDAGDRVRVTATVANTGDAEETGKVLLMAHPLVTTATSKDVTLAPGETTTVEYTFLAETEGDHVVTVGFPWGDALPGALLRVRAPDVTMRDFAFDHPDEACTDTSHAEVTLRNRGAGAAKEVHIHLEVEASDGTIVDRRSRSTGAIAPGETTTATIPLTTPDTCDEDDWYKVRITIQPAYDDEIDWKSGWVRV